MGWLPASILPREALFAYVASALRLAEIYVPFVPSTRAQAEVLSALRADTPMQVSGRDLVRGPDPLIDMPSR